MWDPTFFRFPKKCPKCKTYIWNAEMTKVIVRCLLLDWNHWMSVHAMNFYFYLWLLKSLWPENTFSHISRHLEFIIEQGHRINWVSGSLDFRVTGSLGNKMWSSSILLVTCVSVITWLAAAKLGRSVLSQMWTHAFQYTAVHSGVREL